jgi:hypothetical protein
LPAVQVGTAGPHLAPFRRQANYLARLATRLIVIAMMTAPKR